ncbi:zinc finger protein 62-like isoform X1 [Microplitis mediator]|uniref:zinc finger protein 62-like isoform X1 n=1 Tax=Microplitis mediator TaxID=375433 RepID=UPI00255586F9|nr:zinc finger protein 62-like isoform X1 [Microplitis mediator]
MDDDVVELNNIENLCRLCLSTEDPKSPIFGLQESPVSLVEKIQACLSIEILLTDKLSKLICINCLKSVNQWHNYKESCLKSQEKLQRWLVKQINSVAVIATIKPEPLDIEVYEDNIEIVEMSEDELNNELSNRSTELPNDNALPELSIRGSRRRLDINLHNNTGKDNNKYIKSCNQGLVSDNNDEIKLEPTDDDEDDIDCNVDVESINENDNEGELLLNPMALGASKNMEPDSTQKFNVRAVKKKVRRGPHTHFRGPKVFKRRCPHCQLTLHSKSSYARHINRYHHDAQLPSAVTAANSTGGNSQHQQHQVPHNGLPYSKDDDNSAAEEIEDVEDELVSLEKDAPLTQVQESIISQLKTFSCYACQQSFNDRRSTLNHIRQHMPDLRPYTCIACLTEFPDRSIYKLHCGASFECAMKIALVVPKHGTEKYFTCNMCLRPMPNRKELISHLSKHSDRQYEQLTAPSASGGSKKPPKLKPIGSSSRSANASTSNSTSTSTSTAAKSAAVSTTIGPYRNGDPAHNHTCDYCGMIYRYKPNMLKHQDLCKRLPPEERTSYRCVHCGMTFLVFKKFQSHITTEHNKKELICFVCNAKFRYSNEYLIHHQKHRMINKAAETHALNHWNKTVTMKYGCAVCPEQFDTKAELNDHRSVHLKVKIFSCSICRRMFGNSQSLQEHVNEDHALEVDPNISAIDFLDQSTELPNTSGWSVNTDPGVRSTECTICGKVFANYPNLRRHIRSVHAADERFNCSKCSKTFSNEAELSEHTDSAHAEQVSNRCNYCKKKFDSKHGLDAHQRNAHGITDSKLACDICGKEFGNETSLKIHRGHHFRRDSRLSIRNMPHPLDQVQVEINEAEEPEVVISPRAGRARKSLSNTSLSSSPKSSSELKCQVCDDKFTDVHDLRKHLWDVHCAKNKPEKSFTDDNNLQCELCTNVLPDDKSLDEHMKWHKDNPILSDGLQRPVDISCDVCGKFYSSTKALWKHKKLHSKTGVTIKFQSVKKSQPAQYPCPVCRKVFGNETSMKKHKAAAHYARRSVSVVTTTTPKVTSRKSSNDDEVKPKRPKLDFDIIRKAYNLEPNNYNADVSGGPSNSKKPVSCGICKKLLPSLNSLYKHRQNVHKNFSKSLENNDDNSARGHNEHDNDDEAVDKSRVPCTECDKIFSNMSNMKQHLTKVHGNGNKYYCGADGCNQLFNSPLAKQLHEKSHMNVLYRCTICSRHMFLRNAIIQHLVTEHKNDYSPGTEKSLYKKTDLSNYQVHGAEGRVCPICNITYPNIKAMKIHYVKIHENS